ncbi:MAG: hypothetical protein LBQ94_07895 [Treponema sp.]|jgi:hypothetical protein|nr:hypothetical protein [Treponema sp.]
MDFSNLKEKLRNLAPLELLNKLKEALLAIWSNVFSFAEGIVSRFLGGGSFNPSGEDDDKHRVEKKRLILFGLCGVTVLLLGLLIFIIVRNVSRSQGGSSSVASGLSIPAEELFFPREPDFLPGFLPERERRRFWSLDEIRPYWKAPGNSVWWMEEITSTVDSLMEGVP